MPDRIEFYPFDASARRLEEAELLLKGKFRFSGDTVEIKDGSVFDARTPSGQWARDLHAFEWLPPLSAAGGEAARVLATNLIAQWVRRNSRYGEPSWASEILARRLINLFVHGKFVIANSDVLWRSKLLVSLREQSRLLARTVEEAPEGLARLEAAVAQVLSGCCLNDSTKRLETGLAQLEAQVGAQILPDGGHVSRSPESLARAYGMLTMVMDALTGTEHDIPSGVRSAHDRIAPMLRFFRHGDGRLALFNGGSECDSRTLDALLARDDVKGALFQHAPHSGYQRLLCGRSLVLMDCGLVPEGTASAGAHAGCLSFEFSAGVQRIVVNCGTERASPVAWDGALRATAAHSTVTLADTSMAKVLGSGMARDLLGPLLFEGPAQVDSSRQELPQGCRVSASHDGYMRSFGIGHERSVCLSPRGNVLTGVDRLSPVSSERRPASAVPYAVRFHIHPDVRVSPSQGSGFILKLANGDGWRFRSSENVTIEESVYLGQGVLRRTEQFVIAGAVKNVPVEIGWEFEQIAQPGP